MLPSNHQIDSTSTPFFVRGSPNTSIAIMEFDTKTRECTGQSCQRNGTDWTCSSLPDFGQDFVRVHFGARSLACYSCEWLLNLLALFIGIYRRHRIWYDMVLSGCVLSTHQKCWEEATVMDRTFSNRPYTVQTTTTNRSCGAQERWTKLRK
jgi:hypothetical protein